MKKLLALILALTMVFALASCSNGGDEDTTPDTPDNNEEQPDDSQQPDEGEEPAGDDVITLGMSMNAMDDYQTEWLELFEAYCQELGGIEVIDTNAEGKVDKQLTDIESLIALEPDVILIRASDSAGVVTGFEACAEAGIPTIDSGFGSDYQDTLKILSSQFFLTSLQAQYCIDWLEEHPDETLKVGYVWGAQGQSSTQERYDGWHDTLMDAMGDRVEILAEKVCNWSATETMTAVEDWVQAFPDMNCIVAQSDEMALAASNVLQAAGIGTDECIVIGIDGSEAAQEALRNGTLNATVYTSKKADAEITVDYAIRVANGEDFVGQTIDPGDEISALMTGDNIDEVLEALG